MGVCMCGLKRYERVCVCGKSAFVRACVDEL